MSVAENAGILEKNDPNEVIFMPEITAERLTSMNEEQNGFMLSICHMKINTSLVGEKSKRKIAGMFPPGSLFSVSMVATPILFKDLRDFVDRREGNLLRHVARRIMMTLATSFYEEAEDKTVATEIVTVFLAADRHVRRGGQKENLDGHVRSASDAAFSPSESIDKQAYSVALRMTYKDKKFTYSLEEFWMGFVDKYLHIC